MLQCRPRTRPRLTRTGWFRSFATLTCVVRLLVAGQAVKQAEPGDVWQELRQAQKARAAASTAVAGARERLAAAKSEAKRRGEDLAGLHRRLAAASIEDRQGLQKSIDDASARLEQAEATVQRHEAGQASAEQALGNADVIVEARLQAVVAAARAKAAEAARKEEAETKKRAEAEAVRVEVKSAEKAVAAAQRNAEKAAAAAGQLKADFADAETACAAARSEAQAAATILAEADNGRARNKAARALGKAEERARQCSAARGRVAEALAEAGKGVADAQQALATARKRLGSARKAQADLALKPGWRGADAEGEARRELAATAKAQAERAAREKVRQQAQAEEAGTKQRRKEEERKRAEAETARKAALEREKAEERAAAAREKTVRAESRRRAKAEAERVAREKGEEKRRRAERRAAGKAAREKAKDEAEAAAARLKAARADVKRAERAAGAASEDVERAARAEEALKAKLAGTEEDCSAARSRAQAAEQELAKADSPRAKSKARRSLTRAEKEVGDTSAERDRVAEALTEAQGTVTTSRRALAAARTQLDSAKKSSADMEAGWREAELRAKRAALDEPPPVAEGAREEDTKQTTPAPSSDGKHSIERVEIQDEYGLLLSLPADGVQMPFGRRTLADQFTAECVGKRMDLADVIELCERYTEKLVALQYALARITHVPHDHSDGTVIVSVHTARAGKCRFFEFARAERDLTARFWTRGFYTQWLPRSRLSPAAERIPYKGRFFSERQLQNRLTQKVGDLFNYRPLVRDVYSLNVIPDLTLSGNLRVMIDEDTGAYREVETDFTVEEDLPLHLALSLDNAGTEATDRLRGSARLQYLNLTKHFDVLSLDAGSSPDESYQWLSGSYYYPLPESLRTSLTVYGSRTWVDIEDIAEQTDAESDGWSYGAQIRSVLARSDKHELALSLGLSERFTENTTSVGAVRSRIKTAYTPGNVGLEYHSREADLLGGRTFLSGSALYSREWWLRSDDSDEFSLARVGSSPDFTVYKYKAARVQKLGWGEGPRWLFYAKLEGQYSRNPLIPVEQFAIGGMGSVRGYEEREALGDFGLNATVELRTPLFSHRDLSPRRCWQSVAGMLLRDVASERRADPKSRGIETARGPAKEDVEAWDTIQFLAFLDAGYVRRHQPQPGEFTKVDMLSVGAGVRVSLWKRMQLRLDYGYPLEETSDDGIERTEVSGDGRLHFAIEAQF